MTGDDAATWIAKRWSVDPANVAVERLTGGMINDVFRVRVGETRMIVKHARPYVVTVPSVALSPRRLLIEARCLRELGPGGCLVGVCDAVVRVPREIELDTAAYVLAMDDCGALPDLSDLMSGDEPLDAAIGATLGSFSARLHAISAGLPDLLGELDNRDVQETRARTQYAQVGAWVQRLGRPDHAALAHHAVALGQRFLARGQCLIMGDLWPRSVLIDDECLHVIDWELSHAGSPAQDIGHLAAHLWMHARRAASTVRGDQIDLVLARFVSAYRAELAARGKLALVTEQTLRDADAHAGCEILARVVGPFRAGYLYDQLDPSHASVWEAVELACNLVLGVDTLFAR